MGKLTHDYVTINLSRVKSNTTYLKIAAYQVYTRILQLLNSSVQLLKH